MSFINFVDRFCFCWHFANIDSSHFITMIILFLCLVIGVLINELIKTCALLHVEWEEFTIEHDLITKEEFEARVEGKKFQKLLNFQCLN